MSVRSKMQPGWIQPRGDKGAEMYFNVVFEPNDALKAVTENAIYGKSSPSGSFQIAGEIPIEKFSELRDEEFYVDLDAPEDGPRGNTVAMFRARKVYQSAPSTSGPDTMISFRYVIVDATAGGDYRIGCCNPAASSWMIDHDEVVISVRVAYGRRSQQEIDLLRADLDKHIADCLSHNAKSLEGKGAEERAAVIEGWCAHKRRRLFRALGNTGPYSAGVSLDDPQASS